MFSSAECLLQHCPQVWPEQVGYQWLVHVLFSLSTPMLCCPFQDSRMCPAAEIGIGRLRTAMVLIWVHLYCNVLGSWVCPPPLPEAETGTDRLWTAVVLYLSTPVPCCMFQAAEYVLLHFLSEQLWCYISVHLCHSVSSKACSWNRSIQAVNSGSIYLSAPVLCCFQHCLRLKQKQTGYEQLWCYIWTHLCHAVCFN